MSEVEKLQLDVKPDPMAAMQAHLDHLFREVSLLREEVRTSVNSRRGLPGIAGPAGPQGQPGRDAVIKIQTTDGKIQVIEGDKVAAEIIPVPGPVGAQGPRGEKGDSITGPKGDPGVSPHVDEVVVKVANHIASRLN
jgi:hypothetical protein